MGRKGYYKTKKNKYDGEHPLNTSWNLYYHDAISDRWDIDSYIFIYNIDTCETFWRVINNLPLFETTHSYYLMRDGHNPLWEDTAHSDGGLWRFTCDKYSKKSTIKIPHTSNNKRYNSQPVGFECFINFTLLLVGETICDDPMRFVGVSISPKKNNVVVSLWDKKDDNIPVTYNDHLNGVESINKSSMRFTKFRV